MQVKSSRSENEIATVRRREAMRGPIFRHLGDVVEAPEKRWNPFALETHERVDRRFAWASRRPCREAAILLAGAGVVPEPEPEEGPPAARCQLWAELGGAGALAGGEGSARTPYWRAGANIERHATSRRCVAAQRNLSATHRSRRAAGG